MKELFDFDALKKLISRKDFKFCFDAMNGVAGPFARTIFNI
jgi:phosphoglucomutase